MLFTIFITLLVLLVYTILRYSAWLVSRVLSIVFGFQINVGGFWSRDGWQIEAGCRLAQGKALRRKSAQPSPPLIEFGLQMKASLDILDGLLSRLSLDIKDPIISISQGIFELTKSSESEHLEAEEQPQIDEKPKKKRWIALSNQLSEMSFIINNSTFRYVAWGQEERVLQLSIREIGMKRSGGWAEGKVEELKLGDLTTRSTLRTAFLHANAKGNESLLEAKITSDSVHTALKISDVLWWRSHLISVLANRQGNRSPTTDGQSSSSDHFSPKSEFPSIAISFEVESLACDVTDMDAIQSKLSISFFSFSKSGSNIEVGVDSLIVSSNHLSTNQNSQNPLPTPSFDVHHWGQTLYIGVALLQISQNPSQTNALLAIDDCKFEWSDRFAHQIEKVLNSLRSSSDREEKVKEIPAKRISIKARLKRGAILALAKECTFVAVISDEVAFESQKLGNDFAVSLRNARLGIGQTTTESAFNLEVLRTAGKFVPRKDEETTALWRLWSQAKKDDFRSTRRRHAEEVYGKRGVEMFGLCDTIFLSMASTDSVREMLISGNGEAYLSWSPLLHRVFLHIFRVTKSCLISPNPSNESQSSAPKIPLQLKISTKFPFSLDIAMARYHRMIWRVPSIHFEKDQNGFIVTSPELTITCNGYRVLLVTNVSIDMKQRDTQMIQSRKAFGDLLLDSNKVWTWAADLFHFTLPFEFNFAQVFSEFINSFKWLKVVHEIKTKSFTKDSPLPADVKIVIKETRLELEDDPFETSLQANNELLEDEVFECERRRQMLAERLANVKKANPLLPQTKIDELFASLLEKNSAIYIERWRKQPPEKRPLFVSIWKDLQIKAFADISLHGTQKCVSFIQEFDSVSHYPIDMAFSTLWARGCEFDVESWSAHFRDYPIPYFQATDMHFFGTLVGAEQLEARSLRDVAIPLPDPWETHTVQRNIAPLKFYYDMQCEATRVDSWYGPCWEPCLSMVSLTWNNISSPSVDPSLVLPFWDKMRYLLHGRFSMLCKEVRTIMLASPDPYNSTETVEWCWEDFGLDWLIGEIRIRSGLSVYVRTASKYDDSRILFLPQLKLRVTLDWVCLGDPHDHHSATPCSPSRLPHCATEHDSYRAFRSKCLDLAIYFDVESADVHGDPKESQRSKWPHVLLYANTFRSLEFLLNTLTLTNRPVKKGALFGSPTRSKPQLSKHFRDVKFMVNFPYFHITYWMSHSSDYGFRVSSDGLVLSAFLRLSATPLDQNNLRRRRSFQWSQQQVTAAIGKTQVHVFGPNAGGPMGDTWESAETLLMSLEQLQYIREEGGTKETALHRLICTDLKASWTSTNRDACLVIADGVHRAHLLRSILSNDAIKTLKLKTEEAQRRPEQIITRDRIDDDDEMNRNRSSSDQANSLLDQLIDEASTKLVAHCEQATELPTDSLLGVLQCTADDVVMLNWQVDLLNSQLVLKGCEKDGFLLVTAARTSLTQKIHRGVWKNSQLLGKKSWSAVLSGMQYFAPVSISEGANKERFRWLGREVIEEKARDISMDTLSNYIATGEAVGGIVQGNATSVESSSTFTPTPSVSLQRIVSRCSCEIYFCYFSENLKTDALEETALPPMNPEVHTLDDDQMVDCLTVKHNMLESSSNSAQYEMVVDIINNLVLFIDPKKKEVAEHRRRLRFECQMMNMQQMRESIVEQQTELREIVTMVRSLERQIYYIDTLSENERDKEDLAAEMEDFKAQQLEVSDQLAIFISCYKQRQVEQLRAAAVSARVEADQQAPVARRFEVCFEDCIWKLTESDGQIGVAALQIRNFLYTRVIRIDNSGEHLFEVGTIRVTNLLRDKSDTIYKDTLHQDERVTHLQPAIRILLRDMPPVAGICVKEHFEVNISPMVAQITYRFFDAIMSFFFPGQNIHNQEEIDTSQEEGNQKMSLTRRLVNIRSSKTGAQFDRKQSTLSTRPTASRNFERFDDIDRMRERADKNNLFVYIKIPEVPFVVSYKGKKEKNLLDVDRFHFVFPLCEYHERNWTWLDVIVCVKQRVRRVLLQQFMKQKLLRNRLVGGGPDPFEGVTEDDKKRIALGTTSTMEKKKKK
ncbi:unnamed protein product, partial [Mesorhabditis belari]|uniref:FMP27/BLTP2/Hobbit GFWDK motif-containing RBG unit domain-containing protein n=1 Tax=Mesorhabditis belari TaxID=2138241 RepID=A0AAF3EJU8_9BILA